MRPASPRSRRVCALADATLPERHPYPQVFGALRHLLDALEAGQRWAEAVVRWELALLGELGFGLDLAACAATGAIDDLAYVSPRSGRAVSREAGAAYAEKLLPLPPFLAGTEGRSGFRRRYRRGGSGSPAGSWRSTCSQARAGACRRPASASSTA